MKLNFNPSETIVPHRKLLKMRLRRLSQTCKYTIALLFLPITLYGIIDERLNYESFFKYAISSITITVLLKEERLPLAVWSRLLCHRVHKTLGRCYEKSQQNLEESNKILLQS
uniref:Uncharacterized protein n=1 Tax=Glossina brevipalpis TaxID=37001 RepID=A0A1A9WIM4_9MUSC